MRSIYNFIVTPKERRYDNEKKIGDKSLVLNTKLEDHKFVSREAIITATPIAIDTNIKIGDEVIIHHNIFRRFNDVRGIEKNGGAFFTEELYFCDHEQIFMYKTESGWKATDGYCFVKPAAVKDTGFLTEQKEVNHVGILKYGNSVLESLGFNEGDVVGFTPDSEYEFVINGERLYRMTTNSIIINYGQQGDEEEYNTSWSSSCGRAD
jgi:hypothetical protein